MKWTLIWNTTNTKPWSPMATKEDKHWWDPYETSHKRQFIYQPNAAAEALLCPTSTSFIDSYSRSGHLGSTVYKKDFCRKSACKPESIRTGTASGQRRNNPHPSQSFMMCRRSPEYIRFPCKHPPSEAEIRKALTAQYHSVYRWDFLGMPQGCDRVKSAESSRAALRISRTGTDTEMRDNYRQPKQKPELLLDRSHSGCNKDPNRTCRGIVPTVIQRHIRTQQTPSDLTTYDSFCGKRISNVTPVMKSLLPQELRELCRVLPQQDKDAAKRVLSKESHPDGGNKHPAVCEWISSWTGPA